MYEHVSTYVYLRWSVHLIYTQVVAIFFGFLIDVTLRVWFKRHGGHGVIEIMTSEVLKYFHEVKDWM